MPRFYLTTAIDYVNSPPHLGTAYEKITADVIARFKRSAGFDTHFLMGADEHSLNVRRRAEEQGFDPLDYCERMEAVFRAVWAKLDISYDEFIRTTEERHRVAVQKLLGAIRRGGDLYEGTYEGWYCVSCEAFKQDKDLEDGRCPLHKARPDWIRERNHFFRLSAYRDRLLRLYRERPGFIEPESRRNELTRVLESGLMDLSVSRPGLDWGIPVPFDDKTVVYVWFDALINYLSATGYGEDEAGWEERWPADLHIVGKDITRFHAVIWPAMLLSAGLPVPGKVFGHGFVNFMGARMSKSLGTAVDPLEAADHFGPDPLRLFLVREIQYGQDGDFSWDRFEARYDADLANSLGNLVSRITSMADRYRGGRLPPPRGARCPKSLPPLRRSTAKRWKRSGCTTARARPSPSWALSTSSSPSAPPGRWRRTRSGRRRSTRPSTRRPRRRGRRRRCSGQSCRDPVPASWPASAGPWRVRRRSANTGASGPTGRSRPRVAPPSGLASGADPAEPRRRRVFADGVHQAVDAGPPAGIRSPRPPDETRVAEHTERGPGAVGPPAGGLHGLEQLGVEERAPLGERVGDGAGLLEQAAVGELVEPLTVVHPPAGTRTRPGSSVPARRATRSCRCPASRRG